MSGSSSGTQKELDELIEALRKIEEAEKLLKETIEQRDLKITDLERELADESNKFMKLKDDLTKKEAELQTAKDELQKAKDELQIATDELQKAKARIQELEDAAVISSGELSTIQAKLSEKEAELTRKEDEHKQLIAEKDKQIQEKEANLTAANQKLTEKENELTETQGKLTAAQKQFDADKAALEKEILDLKSTAAPTVSAPAVQDDTEIKALTAKLQVAEQENKELKNKFAAEELMVHEMVAELRKMNDLLNQELGISTTRTSSAIDGLHVTTKTILKQYTQHAKLNNMFLEAINTSLETGKKNRKLFFEKVTAGSIKQQEYSPIALFLMYESMAATWYLIENKYRVSGATDEDKESMLEKIIYDLRQWKTIKNHPKQAYHSKYFKEFIEFWDLK
jgi:chromosome segregation ATPase